jgi:hypothetical protein
VLYQERATIRRTEVAGGRREASTKTTFGGIGQAAG